NQDGCASPSAARPAASVAAPDQARPSLSPVAPAPRSGDRRAGCPPAGRFPIEANTYTLPRRRWPSGSTSGPGQAAPDSVAAGTDGGVGRSAREWVLYMRAIVGDSRGVQ